jgi:hypothetical protein
MVTVMDLNHIEIVLVREAAKQVTRIVSKTTTMMELLHVYSEETLINEITTR